MIIAIYGRPVDENILPEVEQLFTKLRSLNVEILVHDVFYEFLKKRIYSGKLNEGYATFSKHEQLKGRANFLLSIGGDGTLLETISLVRDSVIPILGINTGRLGFLATVSKEEID